MMIEKQIEQKAKQIETIIASYLPKEDGYQKTVLEAMNYSILAGGKRLRPMLMQETYHMLGGMGHVVEPFMAAIEMIHTYSLVHDDLPAMDNDEYRRGRKTTHVVYGEDMAILAGDGLLNFAFETAMKAFDSCIVDEIKLGDRYELVARALSVLAKKAGVYGMIGGQTADVEAENNATTLTGEHLLFIHQHKTAALIEASMMIGGILAGASQETINQLEKCAFDLGVAFQIQDDILDVVGDQAVLGKPVGSDERNGKQTYVTIYGMEQAREKVKILSEDGVYILDTIGGDNHFMKELMLYLIHREK